MPGNVRGLTIFPGLGTQDSSFGSFASPRDAEFVIFTIHRGGFLLNLPTS